MTNKIFRSSGLPIRRSVELLPEIFQSQSNDKFLGATLDALTQPGSLEKITGYIGRKYGKTYTSADSYLADDGSLRYPYQLEPGVVLNKDNKVNKFYDYLDLKNQLRFFGNLEERDDRVTKDTHYSWDPPINWDMFVNYREYFWLPVGPDAVVVEGQNRNIISNYRVRTNDSSEWIFFPDGLKKNPSIVLYRGQTYEFDVNSPGDPFFIRTSNKLGEQSNYNKGVTNNGTENGRVTFVVPDDSPDLLYYQSSTNNNRVGIFRIAEIKENTSLDIENDILGKQRYTSSNGIKFTNGLRVRFVGNVTPARYSKESYIVEGIGDNITLVPFEELELPPVSNPNPEVLFDDDGFDTSPFSEALSYPKNKDYIVINRSSKDRNPWSRYNRWFHRSVIEYAAQLNNSEIQLSEENRAKRPIIEFVSNIQLANHGSIAKGSVDLIDDFTTDAFSIIEGSSGYNTDGIPLIEGSRVIFLADPDPFVKNKIFTVKFITVQTSTNITNRRQISLIEATDSNSLLGECLVVRQGNTYGNKMIHFNGNEWVLSQKKEKVNQPPLFDVFDEYGNSFSDEIIYGTSEFAGSKIFSYSVSSTEVVDPELGFPISYLNIRNTGDIKFEFYWDLESFNYQIDTERFFKKINTGFYKINNTLDDYKFLNCWTKTDNQFLQPIVESITVSEETSEINFTSVIWGTATYEKSIFYKNGEQVKPLSESISKEIKKVVFKDLLLPGDVVTIKVFSNAAPNTGYYEIPFGLEKNPLNSPLETFTLGQINDHLGSAIELLDEFEGQFPGPGNLRDLVGYQKYSRRFLKHSSVAPLSIALLCDKDINIIRALDYSAAEYEKFKSNFLKIAMTIEFNENIPKFVDEIFSVMSQSKTIESAFIDSDMIGSGAFNSIDYVVEDTGINTFALTTPFDLSAPSTKSVYVYVNEKILSIDVDYFFDSTFGFVTITVPLNEGDQIQIREYFTTSFNFIPPTPTKLGLYKKYTPSKFVDDTYAQPKEVIQGHDGSITVCFGDFRDDLLLELENRIYNNIKLNYDESVFDIDDVFSSFYETGEYSKNSIDSILNQRFLRWTLTSDVELYSNNFYQDENPFTYTYFGVLDSESKKELPRHWRGMYQWLYDTNRPHRCPWEMLGFSQKPNWWESEYGPAPYTSGNLILWEDLRDGVIRQGPRAGRHNRYKRPNLLSILPVNNLGELLNPLEIGFTENYTSFRNKLDFKFGDIAPVEYTWRKSSSYPFTILSALALLKPFNFILSSLDKTKNKLNRLGQLVSKDTDTFFTVKEFENSLAQDVKPSGLLYYVVNYLKSDLKSKNVLVDKIANLDVKLSNRIGGFVDKSQHRYLLDSKSPQSKTSSIFIPQENYDIFFNASTPVRVVSYSGVIIEKRDEGWLLKGYDKLNTFFNYTETFKSNSDPVLSVGGVSENFVTWQQEKFYSTGIIAKFQNSFYRSTQSHTSGLEFDTSKWVILAKVPLVGAVEAFKRVNFDTTSTVKLDYGTVLPTIQDVVDFLLGYGFWLKTQGFIFDEFDTALAAIADWETSCKEFMFWTSHNWAPGALISLSPSANKLKVQANSGVVENLLDTFYEYAILKSDGTKLLTENLNVYRGYDGFTMLPVNTRDGIYFARINFVLKEHIAIFNDRTIFNDVLFDKAPGYRQERIKVIGFKTTDWDGDYTSPGFIFDEVNITPWQPFTDYRLGDIVQYKELYYTSKKFQTGSAEFNFSQWTILDKVPTTGLIPNFDYKITQFEDFYNLDADGLESSQRSLGRHAVGYQKRNYLEDIIENDVSQFQFYQGMIKEKGTINSITKLFDKISNSDRSSIELNEEWAFLMSKFGGTAQFNELEFRINKSDIKLNPQPILLTNNTFNERRFQNYIALNNDSYQIGSPLLIDIPVEYSLVPEWSAGYVFTGDIDFVIKRKDDLIGNDISFFKDGSLLWITYETGSWDVLRYKITQNRIIAVAALDLTTIALTTNRVHGVVPGDIIGLTNIKNLEGFFKVKAVSPVVIIIEASGFEDSPEIETSSFCNVGIFSSVRIKDVEELTKSEFAKLPRGSKVWLDSDEENKWNVLERVFQYLRTELADYGVSFPANTGSAVSYISSRSQAIVSNPGSVTTTGDARRESAVVVYSQGSQGLLPVQVLIPQQDLLDEFLGNYGKVLSTSHDGRWLIVGSPEASFIPSNFEEIYVSGNSYKSGSTLLYHGKLWEATQSITLTTEEPSLSSEFWRPVSLHQANPLAKNLIGSNIGYNKQGSVDIFEYESNQWIRKHTLISPRPAAGELFGSSISIGKQEGIEDTSGDVTLIVKEIDSVGGILLVDAVGQSGLQDNVYENISGVDISSPGTGARFDVFKQNGIYTVTVREGGERFAIGDVLKITGDQVGGQTPANDIIINVTAVTSTGSIIGSETYRNIGGFNSILPEVEARFDISRLRENYIANILNRGRGYVPRSVVRFQNRLYACIKSTKIDRGVYDPASTYYPGDVVKFPELSTFYYELLDETTDGNPITEVSGIVPTNNLFWKTASTILPTNTNFWTEVSGVVYNRVAVPWVEKDPATGNLIPYTSGSSILISGNQLGGKTPENDLQVFVDEINADTSIRSFVVRGTGVLGIAFIGTASLGIATFNEVIAEDLSEPGQGAVFELTRTNRRYTVKVNVKGIRYNVGDQIRILGSNIGGSQEYYYMAISATGSVDERGKVYLYRYDGISWKQLDDNNFVGLYDPDKNYAANSIVRADDNYWKARTDVLGIGAPFDIESNDWELVEDLDTGTLPSSAAYPLDSLTLPYGYGNTLIEDINVGDKFGYSVSFNKDGSVLAVSAPFGDSTDIDSFRGKWKSTVVYNQDDVVKVINNSMVQYYKLTSETSVNESPLIFTNLWNLIEDSSSVVNTGSVWIYKRTTLGKFVLDQVIDGDDLNNNSVITVPLRSGDNFGFQVLVSPEGDNLYVSAPDFDILERDKGSVFVFELDGGKYKLIQQLESNSDDFEEKLGTRIALSPNNDTLVATAGAATSTKTTIFDSGNTAFDRFVTRFKDPIGKTGKVYLFERYKKTFVLSEVFEDNLTNLESFGESLACDQGLVLIGSPTFKSLDPAFEGAVIGRISQFTKNSNIKSWKPVRVQDKTVKIDLVKTLAVYDNENFKKIADVDLIDPFNGKILSIAEQEIKFKTSFDPAVYNVGTRGTIDKDQPWLDALVGLVWWDTSTAKWILYNQSDISFKIANWNSLAFGSSIDVYEWVESDLLPSEWLATAETPDGIASGISGTPLYPDDSAYSIKENVDIITGRNTTTKYYFWVKNKLTIPDNISNRKNSAATIASYIENPISSGIPFAAFIDKNTLSFYNLGTAIPVEDVSINLQFYKNKKDINEIHREYQLLVEGIDDVNLPLSLENKWIDSLVGANILGQDVPDKTLNEKLKYGISNRPRQSMFVNRDTAVSITVDYINNVLLTKPFAELIDFNRLNSFDPIPLRSKNLYDIEVDTFQELSLISTSKIKPATLRANIINGRVDTVDVIDRGYGYKNPPPVVIDGTGIGAKVSLSIDKLGRVIFANVLDKGSRYTSANLNVRPFSVLVKADSTVNGYWSIWSWNEKASEFFRAQTQSFNTRNYWKLIDWWEKDFSEKSRIEAVLPGLYLEETLNLEQGQLLRVEEYGAGGWAVFEVVPKDVSTVLDKYKLVGRQLGTIEIENKFGNTFNQQFGYDVDFKSYDSAGYDKSSAREFREILAAAKNDIFAEELSADWNKLFFANIHYVFSEQLYVDWAFKTSFINAIHNVGSLDQRKNYKNDNLPSYQKYIEEVKPFRTKIREYTSRYDYLENTNTAMTDFDLPPAYDSLTNSIAPVTIESNLITTYPWKYWLDNYTYSVVDIKLVTPGKNYSTIPRVIFEGGGGSGAEATAFISNGRISGLVLTNAGKGYTSAPIVKFVGGIGTNLENSAQAVAIIGNSKARNFNMTIKFDRYSKTPEFVARSVNEKFEEEETFEGTGSKTVFDLKYPSTLDKSKVSVEVGGVKLLQGEYFITLFNTDVEGLSVPQGRLIIRNAPADKQIIKIVYEKNDIILEALNRIDKYYNPSSGMSGFESSITFDSEGNIQSIKNDYSQLLTGIDYGGVIVQGATLDVSGGWDALPWFTDGWDSAENLTSDYYILADGTTNMFSLPSPPAEGQEINVYLKRSDLDRFVRIDDPNFDIIPIDQLPENVAMKTFVGNGEDSEITIPTDRIVINSGDFLVFRPSTSDGALIINDVNLIDTNVTGGDLVSNTTGDNTAPNAINGAYSTATGFTASEIVLEGGKFISPLQVPAPEENIPGQVLESVSIKVFHSDRTGSPAVMSKIYNGNGVTDSFDIGQKISSLDSLIVFVDKVKVEVEVDYIVESNLNRIRFLNAPASALVIEVFSISIGGVSLLDYRQFVGDGNTRYFLTAANYEETADVFAAVNDSQLTVGFVNSNDVVNDINKTLVEFGVAPENGSKISVVVLSSKIENKDSLVKINSETIVIPDTLNRTYPITDFVSFEVDPNSNVLVELNNRLLKSVDTVTVIYDGNNNVVEVGRNPFKFSGQIVQSQVRAYINDRRLKFGLEYDFSAESNNVTINRRNIKTGDIITVLTFDGVEYTIQNNNIVLDDDVNLTSGDVLSVTWFDGYSSVNLLRDRFTGGKVSYTLQRPVLGISYVNVYVNGERKIPDADFWLDSPRSVVYLSENTLSSDEIEIISFSGETYKEPLAYEIFKDVLNVNHFKRYVLEDIKLAKNLNYYDNEIVLNDASELPEPDAEKKLLGIVLINGERIQYLSKNENTLKHLRRGLLGTSIPEVHTVGSDVVNVGSLESVPYKENQDRYDFVANGESQTFGDLPFVPKISIRKENWFKDTIPEEFGPCDEIEVFVSGRRLNKNPQIVYDNTVGAYSPVGDVEVEAEFSVDGISSVVRLTSVPPAGTRITVIKRTGFIWYNQTSGSVTSGKTLSQNTTPIVKFLQQKPTKLI